MPTRTPLTRRKWLRLTALGGGAVLGLGALLARHTSGYGVPGSVAAQLRALTPKEYLIVRAMARRMLRSGFRDTPAADDVGAALFVDGFVARLGASSRAELGQLLNFVEHAYPLAIGLPSRFTHLDPARQDAVLGSMMRSSLPLLRGAFDSLKSLCVMAYFSHAATWRAIGYDGPLLDRPDDGWPATGANR